MATDSFSEKSQCLNVISSENVTLEIGSILVLAINVNKVVFFLFVCMYVCICNVSTTKISGNA